jgi:hypothetical protein
MGSNSLNISFRWVLSGNKWDRWVQLVLRVMMVQLITDNEENFQRSLTTFGSFIVKSMYLDLINGHTIYLTNYIWKVMAPLKITIFIWFLRKEVILTTDNLIKRNWHVSTNFFCDQEETIQNLFFSCHFARILWRTLYMTFIIPTPSNVTNLFENW